MCVFLQKQLLFFLLAIYLGSHLLSSFNSDSYKPYQRHWDWRVYTKHFVNIPKEPCPDNKYPIDRCVCKSDLRKSFYLVDCGRNGEMIPDYYNQIPHNATHLVASNNWGWIEPEHGFETLPYRGFVKLTRLIYLDLSANGIKTIESHAFECLTNLVALDLSDNRLTTIYSDDFECLPNLAALNLYWNWLQFFKNQPFDCLTNLTVLDLSRNELETIESHNFVNITNLVYLDLTDNMLDGPATFLQPLSSLQKLSIDNWRNQNIASGISELKRLEHLASNTEHVCKINVLHLQNTSAKYLRIPNGPEQYSFSIERNAFSSWKTLISPEL